MSSINVFLFLFIQTLFLISQATVPPSNTFKFVNEGEFGDYIVEYQANYRALNVYEFPFQLCFYNTTPNAYTLALRMGTVRSELLMRWVWEANRNKPVGEKATFSLGTDGNLVLAEADGKIAWQSNTANKGVVGFKVLPTGNMVLYNSKNKYIWQSFDYPTDTLLVDQSLKNGNKLVSRASAKSNTNGAYSMVLEPKGLLLYNSSKLYYSFAKQFSITKGAKLQYATFTSGKDLGITYQAENPTSVGRFVLAKTKFNTTLTYLRLGMDGNLKSYTYDALVYPIAWREGYTLFSKSTLK